MGEKKEGEEFNFPPPFTRTRVRGCKREGGWAKSERGGKVGKKERGYAGEGEMHFHNFNF